MVAWTPKPRLMPETKTWELKSISGVVSTQHSTLLLPRSYPPPISGSPTHNSKGGWWLALVCLIHRHTTIKGAPVAWAPKPRLCHATKTWERKSVSGVVFSQPSTLLFPAFPIPPFYGSPTHNIKGGWWLALV